MNQARGMHTVAPASCLTSWPRAHHSTPGVENALALLAAQPVPETATVPVADDTAIRRWAPAFVAVLGRQAGTGWVPPWPRTRRFVQEAGTVSSKAVPFERYAATFAATWAGVRASSFTWSR